MTNLLLIEDGPFETRGAVLENDQVVEIQIERPENISQIGSFFLGRVATVLPDLNIAFVDLGAGVNGFLQIDDIPSDATNIRHAVHEGEKLLLQVIKDKIGDKGVQLGRRFEMRSSNLIFRPLGKGLSLSKSIRSEAERTRLEKLLSPYCETSGVMARTSAGNATDATLVVELEILKTGWQDILLKAKKAEKPGPISPPESPVSRILLDQLSPRINVIASNVQTLHAIKAGLIDRVRAVDGSLDHWEQQTPLFEAMGVNAAIDSALRKSVALPSGGNITLEPTEALTVIDVNSGGQTTASGGQSAALVTNLEAAVEICRQIRLRNISGIIIVDFIQMNGKGEVRELTNTLQTNLDKDPVTTRVIGMTELGLMQITRKRCRPPLRDILYDPCPACDGDGEAKTEATILADLFRALQTAAPFVRKAAIEVRAGTGLAEVIRTRQSLIERDLARPVAIVVDPELANFEFKVG